MRHKLLLAAYSWLLLIGLLHFGIDVVSQYLRVKRLPGSQTTLYYGLNTAYAFGEVLFAIMALMALRDGVAFLQQRSGLVLGFAAAVGWLAIAFAFLEYREPRIVMGIFLVLLVSAAAAR